jgi:hypothetical protein
VEETLGHDIVPTMSFATHRTLNAVQGEHRPVIGGGLLAALV